MSNYCWFVVVKICLVLYIKLFLFGCCLVNLWFNLWYFIIFINIVLMWFFGIFLVRMNDFCIKLFIYKLNFFEDLLNDCYWINIVWSYLVFFLYVLYILLVIFVIFLYFGLIILELRCFLFCIVYCFIILSLDLWLWMLW